MGAGPFQNVLRYLCHALPHPEEADRELLRRFVQEKDQDAFATLVRRHGPMVLAACQRQLGNCHDAEDAFQATFLVLARRAAGEYWRDSVGSWLHQVAFRVASRLRTDGARRRRHERQAVETASPARIDSTGQRERNAILDEELTRLPDKYRLPLVICYLEGRTNEEAADRLGWTKGTVSGRLARARDLLRGRLRRRGVELTDGELTGGAMPGPVSAALFDSTFKAVAGAADVPVAALANGVLDAVFWYKAKLLSLAVAFALLASTGALTYRSLAKAPSVTSPSPEPRTPDTGPPDRGLERPHPNKAPGEMKGRIVWVRQFLPDIDWLDAEFSVTSDGTFLQVSRKRTVRGKLPMEAIDTIRTHLSRANTEAGYSSSRTKPADILKCQWIDANNEYHSITFPRFPVTNDGRRLLELLNEFASKYKRNDP